MVLIGRAAHVICANLAHVFHVRLVAPLESRVQHIADYFKLSEKEAAEYVEKTDRVRKQYVRRLLRRGCCGSSSVSSCHQFGHASRMPTRLFRRASRRCGDGADAGIRASRWKVLSIGRPLRTRLLRKQTYLRRGLKRPRRKNFGVGNPPTKNDGNRCEISLSAEASAMSSEYGRSSSLEYEKMVLTNRGEFVINV